MLRQGRISKVVKRWEAWFVKSNYTREGRPGKGLGGGRGGWEELRNKKIKKGWSSDNLKKPSRRNQDPILWAWLELFFTPKRYQFGNTLICPFIISSGSIKEKAPQKLPVRTSWCLRNNVRCTSALFHNSEYLEKLSLQLFLLIIYDWNTVPADLKFFHPVHFDWNVVPAELDFFHPVHFDEVMQWNVCWIFCFRYEMLPSFLCYYISKISMLETVSLLYSKHFLDRYV